MLFTDRIKREVGPSRRRTGYQKENNIGKHGHWIRFTFYWNHLHKLSLENIHTYFMSSVVLGKSENNTKKFCDIYCFQHMYEGLDGV